MAKVRYSSILVLFFLLYGWLTLNLYNIQIEKGRGYSLKAAAQSSSPDVSAPRGIIYFQDKNKNLIPAALNRSYPIVFAVPKEIEDVEEAASLLASVLEEDREKLAGTLGKAGDAYELLGQKVKTETSEAVKKLGLKGVYVEEFDFRYYPFRGLLSQTLGFVGINEENFYPIGLYGLEKFYNGSLTKGRDIVLTIDRNLQSQSEDILDDLVKRTGADGGSVIVEEPSTGRILALVNKPDFNPNAYSEAEIRNFLNPAAQAIYEPGSVFKVITMASGIDSGKLTPETVYFDRGEVTLEGETIRNWDLKAYGKVTMSDVLAHSINTGAVYAEKLVGNENFYNYLVKFGLSDLTGIDLGGEVRGNLNNLVGRKANQLDFASASFGQGIAVTPIALINSVSVIANRGILMKPYLVEGEEPRVIRRVISAETAEQVKEMMVNAVEKAGVAKIASYKLAGKTGTAQVADLRNGGYTDDVVNTYIGFGPADNPKFVVLLKLDKPKGAPLAGLTVVPAFKELAQFILNYYNIPPDNL